MSPAQLFVLVFCTVQVIGVWSLKIPDLSDFTQEDLLPKAADFDYEYKIKGYTIDEAAKIRILTEEIKTFDIENVVRICSVLVSSNFTSVEREPIQNSNFDFLTLFSLESLPFNKSEEAQLYKNVLCSYVSHPTEDVKHAEALGLSMIPFFKFEHIRKRNNNHQSVEAAIQLCDAFYSVDNLANLKSNPIELSENQLVEFKNLWNQVEHLDWDKSPRLVIQNLCNLLNEKISSEEQANALEITVDLYASVLNGLKELTTDNSIQNRVDIYRQICRDINLSFGYSELFVSQNGTLTTDDQVKHFSRYTLRVESDGNKWKSIKNVCVYLNETVTIKYIAENARLSEDQLAQYNSYMPEKDDDFWMDNLKSQFLQTINLCNVIKSDEVKDHLCRCPPGFEGNASVQCQPVKTYRPEPPECTANADCLLTKACINQECRDPCVGTCGIGAKCVVVNHTPICSCPIQYTGNPFIMCQPIVINRPEPPDCTANSDCLLTKACIDQKCRDPCVGTCGIGAKCVVVNHDPICSCPIQYTGDPFVMCQPILEKPVQEVISPCEPSPCGPNSECRVIGDSPSCSCLQGFTGTVPNCRPECISHAECADNLACINHKCNDPCPYACAQNAECHVANHFPHCVCLEGYVGNPYDLCMIKQSPVDEKSTPCMQIPCGSNAVCIEVHGAGYCQCLPEFFGNPYERCRPECVFDIDCPYDKACIRNKCQNPCEGTCGRNAQCRVVNHDPECTCSEGYTGNPFAMCQTIVEQPVEEVIEPCDSSPCGTNSECRVTRDSPSCSCLQGFIGSPPNCRSECISHAECADNLACINHKCNDPCPYACAQNAECHVANHVPRCVCLEGYVGDPYDLCMIKQSPVDEKSTPCLQIPCGSNAVCIEVHGAGSCQCLPEFFGNPYERCRPECVFNIDCPSSKVCIRNKCQNPCEGICGRNAQCRVVNHNQECTCLEGYTGDPFFMCQTIVEQPVEEVIKLCEPSPCGPNSECRVIRDSPSCSCLQGFIGSPPNCRKVEPCSPSPCGPKSHCSEMNGKAVCSCLSNYWNGMERQMEEFVFKASKIFSSPLNDRLELLRGACLTTFTRLYTIESYIQT